MINWYCIDSTAYYISKDSNSLNNTMLCFIKDTNELYLGRNKFNNHVILYEEIIPVTGILGIVYINSNTLEGKIWSGSEWKDVINPIKPSIDTYGGGVVKAIVNLLSSSDELKRTVKSVTYNATNNTFFIECMNSDIHTLPFTNINIEINYNKESDSIKLASAIAISIHDGTILNIEKAIDLLEYNPIGGNIAIKFNNAESDILFIYIKQVLCKFNSDYIISLIITGNQMEAQSIYSRSGYEPIIAYDNLKNVYISAIGIPINDTSSIDENMPTTFSLNREASTVSEESTSNNAITNAAGGSIQNKMSKVDPSKAGQVICISSTGDSEASGYTIGGPTLDGSDTKLAREDATLKYIKNNTISKASIVSSAEFVSKDDEDTSDSMVASEKAVMDALTLRTSI